MITINFKKKARYQTYKMDERFSLECREFKFLGSTSYSFSGKQNSNTKMVTIKIPQEESGMRITDPQFLKK